MTKELMRDYAAVGIALLTLVLMLLLGCDENDPYFPDASITVTATPGDWDSTHGTITVSPSPLPPFEVRFKNEPSPTPVEVEP
ncbi:MAG: hypothetical protein E6Q97_10730 [Desulfurellales bacterium]|nr:MAG: hypothetical protein E6Q97_10730 [Desulfurellales bacterium]